MNSVSQEQSNRIWVVKAFAITATVACHCTWTIDNPSIINEYAGVFFDYWMDMGNFLFFLMAGFFYSVDKYTPWVFVKKKIKNVLVPWIFCGTSVWLYIVLRKGGISIESWLKFVFLRDNYLWFLTDLSCFFLLFYLSAKYKPIWYATFMYLVVTTVLFYVGVIENILPWNFLEVNIRYLLTFFLGMVLRRYCNLDFFNNIRWSVLLIVYFAITYFMKEIGAAGVFLLILRILRIVTLFCGLYALAGYYCKRHFNGVIIKVGRNSFPLYLLHMPAAGIIANILNRSEKFAILTFVRPMIVIEITLLFIYGYEKVVAKDKTFLALIGKRA